MKQTRTLAHALREIDACGNAVRWLGDRTLSQAWSECERPDWMLWLCGKMSDQPGWPTRQHIVLIACDIAESVLPIFERRYPADKRPRTAIEIARRWVSGEANEVRAARARRDASYAASSAYAAAADAAAYAASASFAAADASAYAAAADARKTKSLEICALIRNRIMIPEVL